MKNHFKCNVSGCTKSYVNITILKRHCLAFHSTSNKFQCKVCNKSLASRQNLKEHSFIHTGEKPYVCNQPNCGMSFRQGTHLSAHKKVHQKLDFSINFRVFTEKISDYWKIHEENGENQQLDLPCLAKNEAQQFLPINSCKHGLDTGLDSNFNAVDTLCEIYLMEENECVIIGHYLKNSY